MEWMDKKQSKFYRLRRVSTVMNPSDYGRFIYYKHMPDFDKVIEDYGFEMSQAEKDKFMSRLFHDYWMAVGKMIHHGIEFKWGWRRFMSVSTSIRHPFSINHNINPKKWEMNPWKKS